MRVRPTLLFLTCTLFVNAFCAHAQGKTVEEMLDNLVNSNADAAVSERARAAVDRLSGEVAASHTSQKDSDAPRAKIEHYRLKGGIPFPSPEQVLLVPFEPMSQEAYNRIIARSLIQPVYTPAGKPKKCLYDRTTYVEGAGGDRNKLLSDSLYIAKRFVPNDPSEAFGSSAVLYTYEEEYDQAMYDILQTSAVPCVPYRIRIVSNGRFLDEGKNALRNYTKQQSGKGDLDPAVAAIAGLTK